MDLPPLSLATPFAQPQSERETILLEGLNALTAWHRDRCPDYARMVDAVFGMRGDVRRLEELPWLPVRLFKHLELCSVPDTEIVRRLTSSGTSGQQVSRIAVDAETSSLQVRALAAIVQEFVGRQRLPMLIVDQRDILGGKAAFSARAAGILGFSNFGRQHCYALDESMQIRWQDIARFLEDHRDQPVLLFGFTWVVWQHFLQAARAAGRRLDFGARSTLIHGGGWKKLDALRVDNAGFKQELRDHLGIRHIINYYGMVEQAGSIYMECDAGHFHAPSFADVLVRDLMTLAPAREGAVQVFSLLPRSYPGHSILTEDIGTILGVDDCPCGRKGRYFLIHGRIPKAELRGCSDTRPS